jgi:hypothetical protein
MQKLTLSVDARVVERAKRYARSRGTSVSRIVETMLDLATTAPGATTSREPAAVPPVLARLRGSLKQGSVRDYHAHLERKFE